MNRDINQGMHQDNRNMDGGMTGTLEKLGKTGLMLTDPNEDIRGHAVFDSTGEKLGKVDELLVDSDNRKVRFIQVGSGGFLGIGRDHFLVPVDAIEFVGIDEIHINQTKQSISGSPEYSPDLTTNSDYYNSIYTYYGYSPFWNAGYQYPRYPYYDRERNDSDRMR
jgi:sporulation protein YlmC with PRC-barrel domain